MPRGARIRVYCAGVVLLFVSLVGKAQYQVIGSAYDLEDGRHLYSEYHSCADDDSKCVVDYRDTAGQLIASKKLNYAAGLTQPSLIFKDHRTGVDTRIASQYQDERCNARCNCPLHHSFCPSDAIHVVFVNVVLVVRKS